MNNLLNHRSAYEIKAEVKYQHEVPSDIDDKNRSNVLNRKFPSGRICYIDSDDDNIYTAVSVSPFHPQFDTQIEDGIKDIVYAFLSKNYMPLSSCEGHDFSWDNTYIKLAVKSEEDAELLQDAFSSVPFVKTYIHDKSANVKIYKDTYGRWVAGKMDELEYNAFLEVKSLNELFLRNYSKYYFITITIFEYEESLIPLVGFFKRLYTRYKKKRLLNKVKAQFLEIIQTLPYYEK